MLVLDGSRGEGGGQILRTALTLSLVTGAPFRLERIRARRNKPGLLRQHLTCVEAAAEIGNATVSGAELGSLTLAFRPGKVRAGDFEFAVGTAGSTTLVLQTILLPLLTAPGPSTVVLRGGTHNPLAPSFDSLAHAFAPVLAKMGARIDLQLEVPGFYPQGGGVVRARLAPAPLQPIDLRQRGDHAGFSARALIAHLPRHVAERELAVVRDAGIPGPGEFTVAEAPQAPGPGNALSLALRFAAITEVVGALGERGLRAEDVARQAVDAAFAYLHHDAPVGEHLADQLLLPFALAGGGCFRTCAPSSHTRTNAALLEQMLPVEVAMQPEPGQTWRIDVRRR